MLIGESTRNIFCPSVWSLWLWFLTRAPKFLGIWYVTVVSFVPMRQLLVDSWIASRSVLVTRDQAMIVSINFQVYPSSSGKRPGATDWVDLSCLCDEASIKSPQLGELLGLWIQPHLESDIPQFHRAEAPSGPSRLHLIYFFIWMFICIIYFIFYNKQGILTNYQTHRSWEPQCIAYQSEVQWQPGLLIGIWSGGSLAGLSPYLLRSNAVSSG